MPANDQLPPADAGPVDCLVGRLAPQRAAFWAAFWRGAAQATVFAAVCALLFFAGAWTSEAWR